VSNSDAFTGCHWREARRTVRRSHYGGMSFGPFYVAETDSNRPKHFARLLNLLRRKGRSREDAEDLIQEAMLRLHVYAKSELVVNEEAFLRRAIHNLAIDHYRRNRSVAGREVQIEDADRQHPLIAPWPTPDRVLESQQRLDQLTAILDAVSRRSALNRLLRNHCVPSLTNCLKCLYGNFS
jgi:RNA polymerase sigma factor (sigma-70 family)